MRNLYWMTKVWPLYKEFSYDKFTDTIRQLQNEILKPYFRALPLSANYKERAWVMLFRYIDLQLSRSLKWMEADVDLLAFVLRGLIDAEAWVRFVAESDRNAIAFLNEENIDLTELALKARDVLPDVIPKKLKKIGKRINAAPDDSIAKLLHKLCSKYIHPSVYLMTDLEVRLDDSVAREMILRFIAVYAWRAVDATGTITWKIEGT